MLLVAHAMPDDLPCLLAIPVDLNSFANCSLPQCIGVLFLCRLLLWLYGFSWDSMCTITR